MPGIVTIKEAAKISGLSPDWVYRLFARGDIPGAAVIAGAAAIPRAWAESERKRRASSVTVRQAAEMLGLTIPQVQYAVRRGRLDKTVGGRVTVESIKIFKRENQKNA